MRRTNSDRRTRRSSRWMTAAAAAGAVLLASCGSDTGGTAGTAPATKSLPTSAATQPPAAQPPPAGEDRQVTVDGAQRSFRVIAPASDEPLPVVVAIPDAGNTVDGMIQVTQLDRAAAESGFAAVVPAGAEEAGRTWNAGFCCGQGPSVGLDDVAFLDAVLDAIAADAALDETRVHLTGVSNGAVMAYHYACQRADRIAGVGVVAGTMDLDACQPSQPVPVLEIHGTADDVVPFDGGEMPDFVMATMPAAPAGDLVARWAELNGCAGEPTSTTEQPVTRTLWDSCEGDARVGLIAVEGAGHTWYAPGFGPADGAVDATAEILDFLDVGG